MKLPSFSFTLTKETLLLAAARWVSYGINLVILSALAALVAGGCYMLYLAMTA